MEDGADIEALGIGRDPFGLPRQDVVIRLGVILGVGQDDEGKGHLVLPLGRPVGREEPACAVYRLDRHWFPDGHLRIKGHPPEPGYLILRKRDDERDIPCAARDANRICQETTADRLAFRVRPAPRVPYQTSEHCVDDDLSLDLRCVRTEPQFTGQNLRLRFYLQRRGELRLTEPTVSATESTSHTSPSGDR